MALRGHQGMVVHKSMGYGLETAEQKGLDDFRREGREVEDVSLLVCERDGNVYDCRMDGRGLDKTLRMPDVGYIGLAAVNTFNINSDPNSFTAVLEEGVSCSILPGLAETHGGGKATMISCRKPKGGSKR